MNEKINWDEKSRFEEEPQIFTKDENGSDNLEQDIYYTKPQRIMVNTLEEIQMLFSKKDKSNKYRFYNGEKIFYEYCLENDKYSIRIGFYLYEFDPNKYTSKIEFWDKNLKDGITLSSLTKRGSSFDYTINNLIEYIENNYAQT